VQAIARARISISRRPHARYAPCRRALCRAQKASVEDGRLQAGEIMNLNLSGPDSSSWEAGPEPPVAPGARTRTTSPRNTRIRSSRRRDCAVQWLHLKNLKELMAQTSLYIKR
jgi:hypothetical protein